MDSQDKGSPWLEAWLENYTSAQPDQTLDSIGQLTGRIAHDFNNMLTVIICNIELMKLSLIEATDDALVARLTRNLAMSLEAANKADLLAQQLQELSRKVRTNPTD